jgi:hypothetical protein
MEEDKHNNAEEHVKKESDFKLDPELFSQYTLELYEETKEIVKEI